MSDLLDQTKEAVSEVEAKELKLRTVVESVPAGILMVDRAGRIELANSEAERLFGYGPGELKHESVEMLVPDRSRGVHPNLREKFARHPTKRQMGAGRDLTGRRRDGSEFPVEIGLNHVKIGTDFFVVASIVDISQRTHIDSELRMANEALQLKNQEMEQFVYTVSHDLKAPLVTSLSFLGFLKEDLEQNRIEDVKDSMARIEKACKRMQELINDLLNVSRLGRMQMEPSEVDLRILIDEVASEFESAFRRAGVKFSVETALPVVIADRGRLFQVFENLIGNAVKYGASSENPVISIEVLESKDEIQIAVKDNGAGIDPAYHSKIFGLFQRLQNDSEGTGVGLAIVSRIMQLHKGRAWVESQAGNGAAFWITLPRARNQESLGKGGA